MAALCTGNYGLSQNCTDDSKEYFFVKLTDSAYRAVEEYQRNKNKYNTHATIQIIGNGGVLSFPTVGGNPNQKFSFSIDEIEGSFECIRQQQSQLDVLGALPYKMRIHANDDVYETTRHRMAVAEETQKNKCTREIKPNQTDIGRKVKLKNSINRLTNIPPKRDQVLNNLVNSSSSVSSSLSNLSLSSNNSNTNNSTLSSSYLMGSNHIPSLLSPISSLNGNCNNSNSSSTTTTSIIGNHHSSSNSSLSTSTNHHHNNSGPLKNSSSSNLSSNNSLNNLSNSHHSSSSSSKLLSGFTSASGLTPGISSASSLSSALSSAAGSGTSGINNVYLISNNSSNRNGSGNSGSRRGLSSLTGSSNRSQKNSSRHAPDITKRKIRERLIHLLALKPFKKPELHSRLQNEGIREKERVLISGILKEIATMRDNTYNLKRQIWNDVNEDWPFYTEQELQMLKRRKPQNLTPPLSSDGGSSTSGQSPTSTHNGSPPPAVKRPSLDRDRFYEEPVAKKQRISHFRKDTNEISRRTGGIKNSRDSVKINSSRSRENHDIRTSSNYFGSNKHHNNDSEENAMGLSYSVLGHEAARRISPRDEVSSSSVMNGHSNLNINSSSNNSSGHYHQNNHHNSSSSSYHHNNHHSNNHSSNSLKDSITGNGVNVRQQSPSLYSNVNSNSNNNIISNNSSNGNSSSNTNNHHNSNNSHNGTSGSGGVLMNGDSHSINQRKSDSPSPLTLGISSSNGISSSSSSISSLSSPNRANAVGVGGNVNGGMMRTNSPMSGLIERGSAIHNNSNSNMMATMMNQGNSNSNNNSNGNGNSSNSNSNINNSSTNNNGTIGGPLTNTTYDFSRFTKITSIEQRRLYKTEFESDYQEYRQLLHKIESVGQRFQILAQRLNNARNDDANYKLIKRQIVSEYLKINREQEHQKAKARFDYLHAKLAHIKALVSDFDEQYKSSLSGSSSSSSSQQQQQQQLGNNNGGRISSLSPSNINNIVNTQNLNNSINSNCINNMNGSNNTSSSSSSLRTSSPLSGPVSSLSIGSVINCGPSGTSNSLIHSKQENY